jgi:hypothetical protein
MLNFNVIDGDALLVARPSGIIDAETAEGIVEFVEIKEEQLEMGFNRFCDLTALEGIELRSADIRHLADRRRAFNPNDIRVKSAFLATDPLAFGIARMYEQMLNSPRIKSARPNRPCFEQEHHGKPDETGAVSKHIRISKHPDNREYVAADV